MAHGTFDGPDWDKMYYFRAKNRESESPIFDTYEVTSKEKGQAVYVEGYIWDIFMGKGKTLKGKEYDEITIILTDPALNVGYKIFFPMYRLGRSIANRLISLDQTEHFMGRFKIKLYDKEAEGYSVKFADVSFKRDGVIVPIKHKNKDLNEAYVTYVEDDDGEKKPQFRKLNEFLVNEIRSNTLLAWEACKEEVRLNIPGKVSKPPKAESVEEVDVTEEAEVTDEKDDLPF